MITAHIVKVSQSISSIVILAEKLCEFNGKWDFLIGRDRSDFRNLSTSISATRHVDVRFLLGFVDGEEVPAGAQQDAVADENGAVGERPAPAAQTTALDVGEHRHPISAAQTCMRTTTSIDTWIARSPIRLDSLWFHFYQRSRVTMFLSMAEPRFDVFCYFFSRFHRLMFYHQQ